MDRLLASTKKLRRLANQDADTILRADFLNAVRRAWQFAPDKSSSKDELAMVYHKLKNGTDSIYAKAWKEYFMDVSAWLSIPILEASYGARNMDEHEKGSSRSYPKEGEKTWIVTDDDWNSSEVYNFLQSASKKPQFYIRDLVNAHDSVHYMGKLWQVSSKLEGGTKKFVLQLID